MSDFGQHSPLEVKLWWSVPPKLKRCLVRSKLSEKPPSFLPTSLLKNTKGNTEPCRSKRCKTCRHISSSEGITSSQSGLDYPVATNANCHTSDLVYLIECGNSDCVAKKVPPQYVGETSQKLRERLNGHRSDVRHKEPTPVGKRFNLPHHSFDDVRLTVIEKTNGETERHQREYHWISQLMTDAPLGLNEEHPLKGCKPFSRSRGGKPMQPAKHLRNTILDDKSFYSWDGRDIVRANNENMAQHLKRLDKVLRVHHLAVAADVPGDGSCLFHSLARFFPHYSHLTIRQMSVNFLRNHKDFLETWEAEAEDRLNALMEPTTSAEGDLIFVAAHSLQVTITIVDERERFHHTTVEGGTGSIHLGLLIAAEHYVPLRNAA